MEHLSKALCGIYTIQPVGPTVGPTSERLYGQTVESNGWNDSWMDVYLTQFLMLLLDQLSARQLEEHQCENQRVTPPLAMYKSKKTIKINRRPKRRIQISRWVKMISILGFILWFYLIRYNWILWFRLYSIKESPCSKIYVQRRREMASFDASSLYIDSIGWLGTSFA